MGKFFDVALKILTALMIPLILWGIKLEVTLAVQKSEVARLQEDVKVALAIKDGLAENTNALGRLEEKLSATDASLKEIRELLRSR